MAKKLTLQSPAQLKQSFTRRILAASILLLILASLIIARLIMLQYVDHQRYTTLAKENQLSVLPIAPTRGLIYDRNGVLLAENVPVFSLEIIPDKVKDLEQTIQALQTIIPITDGEIEQFNKLLKQKRRFESVPLSLQLTEAELSRFAVNQHRFPGVLIKARLIRHYPEGSELAHVIGYVGRINDNELAKVDKANYSATNFIGKVGIERYYEAQLHGTVGYQEVETDASGRIVRVLKRTPPVPGDNLYLSIDSRLQQAVFSALGDYAGSVVMIEPNSGQVLAMVSKPAYDPNAFVRGISDKDYKTLTSDPAQPLYNRAIRGRYPPGSTVKPFLGLEGLQSNTVTPQYEIFDPGFFQLKNSNHKYRCWKRSGHGWVNISSAIQQSCDTYFYNLSVKLGIDRIDKVLNEFGFGHSTGIDMGEELPGLVPSPAWKRRTQGEPWYTGDTIITSIGQGFMLSTPIQLAVSTATLAERGQRFKPTLLKSTQQVDNYWQANPPIAEAPATFSPDNWRVIIDAMQEVTSTRKGTAYRTFGQKKPTYTIAAKTGTSQVFSARNYEHLDGNKDLPEKLRDHSLFIGFAPIEQPEVAIAVIVEHNPGMAPKVAREVLDVFFQQQATQANG